MPDTRLVGRRYKLAESLEADFSAALLTGASSCAATNPTLFSCVLATNNAPYHFRTLNRRLSALGFVLSSRGAIRSYELTIGSAIPAGSSRTQR